MNKLATIATGGGLAFSSRSFDRIQLVGIGFSILLAVYVLGSMLKSFSQRWLGEGSRWRAIAGGVSYLLAGVLVSIPMTLFTQPDSHPADLIRAYVLTFSWSVIVGIAVGAVACLITSRFRSS